VGVVGVEIKQSEMKQKKPIALITDDIPYAVQWALTNFKGNVVRYTSNKREIVLADGTIFIVCSIPEHLLAMEISDWKDAGGNKKPASHFLRMIELAQTRIR
jgi:hypothetical protein